MLTNRRRDGLYLALLVSLAVAAPPLRADAPFPAMVLSAAALGAGAQEDEEWDDEESGEDEGAFVEDEEEEEAVEDEEEFVEDDSEVAEDEEEVVEDDSEGVEDDAEGLEEDAESAEDEEAFGEDDSDAAGDAAAGLEEDAESAEDESGSDELASADVDEDVEYVEDYEDDSWAPDLPDEVEENEADDAIAFDEQYDEEWVWEVEAVEDGGGVVEDEDTRDYGDGFSIGQILQVSGGRRSPSSGGARSGGQRAGGSRPAPRRGNEPEGDDVPYAFGGRPVAATAVPWQAQIFNPGAGRAPDGTQRPVWMRQHNCGGALIADDWVLTAAHCINQQKVDLGFKVRLGAQDLSQGDGQVYRIERIVRHSQYDENSQDLRRPPNMYANDIALLRIVPDEPGQRRDPRFIRPIPLNRAPLANGIPVTVTGWGAVGKGATNEGSALILRVDLRLMDQRTCESRPRRAGKVHAKVFCAASPLQSTCGGDSGGPVVPTNGPPVLAGLVSWGSTRCGGDGLPGLYTRVDQYIGWIEQAMRLPPTRNRLP